LLGGDCILNEILAKRLKEARVKKGWTQEELAGRLGVTNGTVSGYERNYREPDTITLSKIADLLDVSADWLLGKKSSDWQVSKTDPMAEFIIPDASNISTDGIDDVEAVVIPALRRAWSHLPPEQLEKKIKLAKKSIKIAKMLEKEENEEK
jgi:transcriptional regulator with XRE-family HTH domain